MAGGSRGATAPAPRAATTDDVVIELIIRAGRAISGIAQHSLSEVNDDVTPPQFRTLVVLATNGPRRLADLAEALDVSPSTTTRMCDRLETKGFIERTRDELDRREVNLELTSAGRKLVEAVLQRRRAGLSDLLELVPDGSREDLVHSLSALVQVGDGASQISW